MNILIHLKMKMLIVLMFCIFMTFSMLFYVMNQTEKCGELSDEMCFPVKKSSIHKASYVFFKDHFKQTQLNYQLLRPISSPINRDFNKTSTTGYFNKSIRTTRAILKILDIDISFGNKVVKNMKQYSTTYKTENIAIVNQKTVEHLVNISSTVQNDMLNVFNKKFHPDEYNPNIQIYIDRQKNLQQFCHKYFNSNEKLNVKKMKLNHILIDEKHKILYCYVPKVACTNWKRVFLVLTGKAHNISQVINLPSSEIHAKNLFKSLQNYTVAEVLKIREEYTKFIFVRHPFERLLSAYRNKLENHYDSSKYFQARFGKYIIKNFRKNPSNVSLEKGDDVTFAEFVNYLTSSDPSLYNEHWQRVTDLCHPCLFHYDFIGKYETLTEDSHFILKYLGLNISFPMLPKPSTTAFNLKKYYNTLGKSAIYKLYNIYQMDFRLFNYDLFNITDWFNNS